VADQKKRSAEALCEVVQVPGVGHAVFPRASPRSDIVPRRSRRLGHILRRRTEWLRWLSPDDARVTYQGDDLSDTPGDRLQYLE
jgi:hypothetical protein